MEIRVCLKEDLTAVYELMEELSKYSDVAGPGREEIEMTFEAMNKQPGIYQNWVARQDDKIVGFLSLVIYKTMLHPKGTALINELVVDSFHRKQGIASALAEHAVEFAREAGGSEIEVGTEFKNKRARNFYKKAGFNKEFLLLNRGLCTE